MPKADANASAFGILSLTATAAGEEKNSYDDEPDNVVVIKNVAKAVVIHKEFLQKFLRAFLPLC